MSGIEGFPRPSTGQILGCGLTTVKRDRRRTAHVDYNKAGITMTDIESHFEFLTRSFGEEVVVTISARQLHSYLDPGRDFPTWFAERVEQYGFIEEQDFVRSPILGSKGRGGHNRKEYEISIDMAKELAMVERNDKGRQARRYFIACEKELLKRNVVEAAVAQLLLPAPLPWEMRFNDGYYQALSAMTRLHYTGHRGGTPPLFGKITDEWVYQPVMPAEVLVEMRSRRRGGQKLHQWLSEGGLKKVESQIKRVQDLATSSTDYQDFCARGMRLFPKVGQLRLIYPMAA